MAETIRQAILDSGQSAHQIAAATGIPQPTISRFIAGADMRLATADKLAVHLGLALLPITKQKGKR